MAAEGWDKSTDTLIIDKDQYDVGKKEWVAQYFEDGKTMPSQQDAYKKLHDGILSLSTEKETGYVKLSVEHYSPTVAKQWVDWLVADINSTVMRQEVSRAEQAIEYLKDQVQATSVSDLQQVFFRLIEEQTKTVMLANVSPEYLFRTIDPAVVPELKSGPRRMWIVFAGLLLGGMLGVAVVLARERTSFQRH
jgi:LPS O-antigen subunit length determinant protein (WzzB/FepE family)